MERIRFNRVVIFSMNVSSNIIFLFRDIQKLARLHARNTRNLHIEIYAHTYNMHTHTHTHTQLNHKTNFGLQVSLYLANSIFRSSH